MVSRTPLIIVIIIMVNIPQACIVFMISNWGWMVSAEHRPEASSLHIGVAQPML
jgi:hypothetical protein